MTHIHIYIYIYNHNNNNNNKTRRKMHWTPSLSRHTRRVGSWSPCTWSCRSGRNRWNQATPILDGVAASMKNGDLIMSSWDLMGFYRI